MELHLTSEQAMLRESAAKFVAAAGPKTARASSAQEPGFAPERLVQAGDLGWLRILVPPDAGGLGLGLTELALVLQQAGRELVCEPVGLAAISAAALAQRRAPHPMLERALAGTALIVPALQESPLGDDLLAPRTLAEGEGETVRLTGRKMFVCADGADGFLVSAAGSGGPLLAYVNRDAPGLAFAKTPTVDGRRLWSLDFAGTPADRIDAHPSSRNAVDALLNLALFAAASEALGVMERALEITLDYMRIRKQFGRLIGSFQALQHQAVNAYIRMESTRSLVFQIAANSEPYGIDPPMAAAVKAKASEDALAVTEACIQLHGAIGFTDEHDIGLYLKRAMLLSSLFGNAGTQRRRYVAMSDSNA